MTFTYLLHLMTEAINSGYSQRRFKRLVRDIPSENKETVPIF